MNINDEFYVVMLLKQKHNRPVFFREQLSSLSKGRMRSS